ncbi:Cysteine desulfurase IscS, partial [Geodia barretti]
MKPYFLDKFGNASSTDHRHGSEASAAVESARGDVARAIGAKTDEIIFTSGATESDNLAIRGVAEKYKDRDDLGRIDIGELESAITDKTVMISVMAANNEIGVIPDIKKI